MESLSAYARQFLDRMEKPSVDSIEGLSPAVAIEQKNPTKTSRSTVGTATEIYDFLRLMWARIGRTFCPKCGREMRPDTVQSVVDAVLVAAERYALRGGVSAQALGQGHARSRARESARAGFSACRDRRRRCSRSTISSRRPISRRRRTCSSSSTGCRSTLNRRRGWPTRLVRRFAKGDGDVVILFSGPVRSPIDGNEVRARAIHRSFRVRQRWHARAGSDAAALLVQQSARRVPALQRFRRDARVRRVAGRTVSRSARSAGRRDRSVDQAALRQQAQTARGVREEESDSDGRCMERAHRGAARSASQHGIAARIRRRVSVPARARGEALQAVHPRLSAPVSDRAGVPRCHGAKLQARRAQRSRRRQDDRRRSRICRSTR